MDEIEDIEIVARDTAPYNDEFGSISPDDEPILISAEDVLNWVEQRTGEDGDYDREGLVDELMNKLEKDVGLPDVTLADVDDSVVCERCSEEFYQCSICDAEFETDHGLRVHKGRMDHWKRSERLKRHLSDLKNNSGDTSGR